MLIRYNHYANNILCTYSPTCFSSLSLPIPSRSFTVDPVALKNPLAIPRFENTLVSPCFILISELPNIMK